MKKVNWQYSLGEILIVIIGISIAFGLNRCSENSKNEQLKHQYLTNLKLDVEADKMLLAQNIEALQTKIEKATVVLPQLREDNPDGLRYMNNIFDVVELTNFNSKDITYQTLINSGDLKLFEDFHLKTSIEAHYSNYEEMMQSYVRQESIVRDYLGNYLINHADYDNIQKGKSPFENMKLLKNIIQSMRGSFLLKVEATQKGLASCDSLLITLNKALNN